MGKQGAGKHHHTSRTRGVRRQSAVSTALSRASQTHIALTPSHHDRTTSFPVKRPLSRQRTGISGYPYSGGLGKPIRVNSCQIVGKDLSLLVPSRSHLSKLLCLNCG